MPNTRVPVIQQKLNGGAKSICIKCFHRNVCRAIDNQPCIECNQFTDANGVTAQEWISVKDRLPENDYGKHWKERKYYLVRLAPSDLMCVAHYGYKEYGWWIDGHDCVLSATNFKEVTHWMEINNLPQPPKGE